MKCFTNFNQIITLANAFVKDGRNLIPGDLSIIEDAAIIFDENKIFWVGKTDQIPKEYSSLSQVSKKGYILTPEIVDSHTHLVFGGNRAFEYTMRLNGADYNDIANAGGGILSTMRSTITESSEDLYNNAVERIERIHSYGVGSIEIKSGYALTYEKELEISKLIQKLKVKFKNKIQIHNTFLAAHAIPKEFKTGNDYLTKIVIPLLEELNSESIIDSVDIFHEEGYFSKEDVILLFDKAKSFKIPVRIHADEFNDNKGAILATEYNALSADHLLCTTKDGIQKLANSNTVATLLPGTAFFLGKPLADARGLLDAGCKVALASDYNPGSCHCDNLVLIASLAAKNLHFNIAELWTAITLNAAHSLNLKEQGVIKAGMSSRFTMFKCETIDEVTYNWGRNLSVSF